MLLLPKKVGSYTLQRKLGTGGVAESYVGTSEAAPGRPVVIRRILPYVLRDAARASAIDGRVKDLLGVRHPFLVHVVESFGEGEEQYLVEEYVDGVSLDKVLAWCRQSGRTIPHNVFLNIATQVCNGLEALHGRAGKGSNSEHVLHLALKPGAIFVTRDGKVMVGGYGLTRSPTSLPHGGVSGPVPSRMEYLSPEQTHPDQKLAPASDIFALGAVLYELLTIESLFRADSNLQTIHRVRRAEVTTQLLRVKELLPGLDKVLYRALSLNPRHRYQRAFVLREDLRGLMAGYSFATIAEDTRTFLQPLLETLAPPLSAVDAAPDAPADADSFAESPITEVNILAPSAPPPSPSEPPPSEPPPSLFRVSAEDYGERTENTSPRMEDPPTELHREPLPPAEELDRPTLPGQDERVVREDTLAVIDANRPPPDPTVSAPDIHRPPAPPPLNLAPVRELRAVTDGATPNSTAAYLAKEAATAVSEPAPGPSDTAI